MEKMTDQEWRDNVVKLREGLPISRLLRDEIEREGRSWMMRLIELDEAKSYRIETLEAEVRRLRIMNENLKRTVRKDDRRKTKDGEYGFFGSVALRSE
jgi:hypothetical protein